MFLKLHILSLSILATLNAGERFGGTFHVWQWPLWSSSVPLLVFPETDQLRHVEGKPFPHLLCHSSLLLHGFSFVFVFYFHPSALNNLLRAGSSFGPLRVWEHSPAPSPNSWSLHRNVPDCVHTPMSCKIVLRKLPNEVAREFELDLGTGEMQCRRPNTRPEDRPPHLAVAAAYFS